MRSNMCVKEWVSRENTCLIKQPPICSNNFKEHTLCMSVLPNKSYHMLYYQHAPFTDLQVQGDRAVQWSGWDGAPAAAPRAGPRSRLDLHRPCCHQGCQDAWQGMDVFLFDRKNHDIIYDVNTLSIETLAPTLGRISHAFKGRQDNNNVHSIPDIYGRWDRSPLWHQNDRPGMCVYSLCS